MEVINFRKTTNTGNLMGYLTIKTSAGFEMKGFKLIEGQNGLFIGAPSVKGKDETGEDKWYEQVWIPKELNQDLINMVSQHLDASDLTADNVVPF